jgi:hypothetical protein
MSRLTALATVLAVMTLGIVAHAQTEPKVLFQATADRPSDVLVWVDSPEGVGTDLDTTRFEDLFAGTTWLWLDSRVLLIRRGETLVASANYRALDDTNTFWALHNRREYTLDGSADRDPVDPTTGGATLYITVPGEEDDEFVTARVELTLKFTQ